MDLALRSSRETSIEEIDGGLMKTASESYLQGILGYCNEQPVSNEWGNANRIVDLVRFMAEKDRAT